MKNNILHIDTGKGFRGGQQQAFYLHKILIERGYNSLFICKSGSKLESRLKAENLPYATLPLMGEFDVYSSYKVAKIAKNRQYSIICLHCSHSLTTGVLAKGLFNKKLKLIGIRRVDFHIRKKLKYNTPILDKIVAISEKIKSVLLSDGIDENKIDVIRSGIDTHKFDNAQELTLRNELNLTNNDLIITTVAALTGHKDYPTLLKCAEIVLNKYKNVHFISAGDGKNSDEIKELASGLNLNNRFHFLGYRNDVGNILKSSDIFVLSSKEEGLGTSLLDAMSVSLPIVATNAGGIPEIVKNELNGLLVEKKSPEKLADGLSRLIEDKNLREKFGRQAKDYVENHSILKTVDSYEKLFEELSK